MKIADNDHYVQFSPAVTRPLFCTTTRVPLAAVLTRHRGH